MFYCFKDPFFLPEWSALFFLNCMNFKNRLQCVSLVSHMYDTIMNSTYLLLYSTLPWDWECRGLPFTSLRPDHLLGTNLIIPLPNSPPHLQNSTSKFNSRFHSWKMWLQFNFFLWLFVVKIMVILSWFNVVKILVVLNFF